MREPVHHQLQYKTVALTCRSEAISHLRLSDMLVVQCRLPCILLVVLAMSLLPAAGHTMLAIMETYEYVTSALPLQPLERRLPASSMLSGILHTSTLQVLRAGATGIPLQWL